MEAIWRESSCVPRQEVLDGSLTEAELALNLSAIVHGDAKPPYDSPATFFDATHLTRNLESILEQLLGRLAGTREDVNPIIVLDVGFGGGKTHSLVALYYSATSPSELPGEAPWKDLPSPEGVRVVAISGDEYGSEGVQRDGTRVRTLWGDIAWQIGAFERMKRLDEEVKLPSLSDVKGMLRGGPVLVLLDELPTYLRLAADDEDAKNHLHYAIQFLQRLVLAVSEKEDASLVIAIAEDAYRAEAERARTAIEDVVSEALADTRAHIRRKEVVMTPMEEDDVVHVLKRRLFASINQNAAKAAANAYHELYTRYGVPDDLKSAAYEESIEASYPFHPALVQVLYERVSTIDRFHRTRGALRLLARIVRRIWREKEEDATLIHPFHVDLADGGIVNDLTEGLGESRRRNALEADIWRRDGGATAQSLDKQSEAHWGASLVRRACNTIYLYSLSAGRQERRGIEADLLAALCATPANPEHFLRLRDTVLNLLMDRFHYIDRRGERFEFVREPTPAKVIELEARNITEDEATQILLETTSSLFADGQEWLVPELFPKTPAELRDSPAIQVAVLNPNLYALQDSEKLPEAITRFLIYSDARGRKLRRFRNDTFLLVASKERLEAVRNSAKRVAAARLVREDPTRYGIPRDRKLDVEEYLSRQEKNVHDYVRATFVNVLRMDPKDGKPKASTISPSGYGSGKSMRAVMANHLLSAYLCVKEEPLDPNYILEYAWPQGADNLDALALFQRLHMTPGLIMPATRELFLETVSRGVTEGTWILQLPKELYAAGKAPRHIPLDETTRLWLPEAARREGLLKKPGAKGKEMKPPKIKPGGKGQEFLQVEETVSFQDEPLEDLASDLEVRAKRGGFSSVMRITLQTQASPILLLHLQNLFIRMGTDPGRSGRIDASLSRPATPRFDLSLHVTQEDAHTEEGKTLLKVAAQLASAEVTRIDLTLEWLDGESLEAATDLIRSVAKELDETITARMDAVVRREEA